MNVFATPTDQPISIALLTKSFLKTELGMAMSTAQVSVPHLSLPILWNELGLAGYPRLFNQSLCSWERQQEVICKGSPTLSLKFIRQFKNPSAKTISFEVGHCNSFSLKYSYE